MPRIKRGKTVRRKHKKIKAQVKGYIKSRRASVKRAKEAIYRAGRYSYRDRRTKKRDMRRRWIVKINAGLSDKDLRYSEFIKKLKDNKIELDRKILADLAENEPKVFEEIVEKVR
jgi:large subunit ribosomal protein L20